MAKLITLLVLAGFLSAVSVAPILAQGTPPHCDKGFKDKNGKCVPKVPG